MAGIGERRRDFPQRSTARFHYEPAVKFVGGARECRTLEALPIIEDMVADFSTSPAQLAEARWVEQEAQIRTGRISFTERVLLMLGGRNSHISQKSG